MLLKSSRLRRILLVAAVTAVIACSVSAALTEESDSVSIDAAASEPDANSVTVAEFTATNEWQELLPGQGVPPGLHVRMNLETGKREAKLLDPEEEDNGESMGSVVVDSNTKDKTVTVSTSVSGDIVLDGNDDDDLLTATDADDVVGTPSQLKEAEEERADEFGPDWNHEKIFDVLKALPELPKVEGMDIHEAHEKLSPAAFRRQIVALWKKRQAELKEAFESLQDDAKYLGNLLEQFSEAEHNNDTTGQLNVLEVLEWEVQDLDKTRVFNYIGGFGIISDYLNSTNLPVRSYAEWVIGSATKNYNDGQEWAIDAGVLPKLMSSLSLDVPDDERAASDVLEVKKKAIYALSSIVRSNERGRRLFLLNNGPEFLAGMINDAHPDRLQLKVLYFVYDLLVETADSKLHIDDNQSAPPTLLELEAIFQSTEWCERVCTTFVRTVPLLADRDVIELVDAMSHQHPACQDVQRASGVMPVVEKLAQAFAEDQGRDDEEKKELAHFFHQFLSHVSHGRSPEPVPSRS